MLTSSWRPQNFLMHSHLWSLVVTRGQLVVTRGHSWSFVVTGGHSWSLVCTFRHDHIDDFRINFFHKIFNTIWGNLIKDNLIRQIVFGGHFLYSRDLHVCSRCYCTEKLDAGLNKGTSYIGYVVPQRVSFWGCFGLKTGKDSNSLVRNRACFSY